MISLENETLTLRFPNVHARATCAVSFMRTLRIPDDNREYPLPPGLGEFPLHHVDDYANALPAAWRTRGGVFLPMHQSEAMWISFGSTGYPMALKVAAGKINAVTGEAWSRDLSADPQDYLVVPHQPWLDGFCVAKGTIRQFVAMPLGKGFTAEEQLTGQAEHGGLQIVAFPMKASVYKALFEQTVVPESRSATTAAVCDAAPPLAEMGLAPGGLMRQKIYEDDYGIDAWDTSASSRCFVHLLNSVQFLSVTGAPAPTMPPTAKNYSAAGLPWFEHYGGDKGALEGAQKLAGLHSVAAKSWQQGAPLAGNEPAQPHIVKTVGGRRQVREDEAL